MKLTEITRINYRKLFFYKTKSLYLILPIALLIILGIIVTSQVANIKTATDKSFFGTVAEKSRLIELSKDGGLQISKGGRMTMSFDSSSDNSFNENDLEAIKAIENVETAAINSSVPVSNVKTANLFEDATLNISSLTGIDSSLAGLYTDQDFIYTEGEPIPIILNANAFIKMYEDWGGKDSITMELGRPGSDVKGSMDKSPIKTEAIDYEKEDLIGKEFEVTVGGLEEIQSYSQSFTTSGITFAKKSAETIAAEEAARSAAISPYWDYAKIKMPLTYKFVVVGVIEDSTNIDSYIPSTFADKLMNDYISNQLNARTASEIPVDSLDNIFTGIKFDGVEFSTALPGLGGFKMVRMVGGPGGAASVTSADSEQATSYAIPGLVIKTEREESDAAKTPFGPSGDPEGIHTDATVYSNVQKTGTKILIKTKDIYSREGVVTALNDSGYAYQDLFKSNVFSDLQKNLNLASVIITCLFIGVSGLVIMFTMGKFVSESTKEIGVLRSIGAKRSDIRNMFVSQAILYTLVAYVFGSFLGLALNLLVSGSVFNWFDSTIGDSLRESFNVVVKSDKVIFSNTNFEAFAVYSIILLLIAFFVSLIPAIRASMMSPVSAIKGE